MPRNPDIPRANHQYLRTPGNSDEENDIIKIGSADWFDWLELRDTRSFAFEGVNGRFTARKENKQRGSAYWYAYRWINGKTAKAYLGTSSKLTREKLNEVASRLAKQQVSLPFAGT
jgi:hypothetical protein